MGRSLKIILGVIIAIFVLLAGVAFAIPYVVNVDSYRDKIVDRAQAALGRKVSVEQIRLSVFPLAIRADKFAVGEDPAFGSGDFASVDKVLVRVGFFALLGGKLDASVVEAVNPHVALIKNSAGAWNIDSLAQQKTSPGAAAAGAAAGAPALDIAKLRLVNGTITIDDRAKLNPSHQSFDKLNLTMENLAIDRPFDFLLSVTVDKGTIEGSGTAGPLKPGTPPALPLQAHMKMDGVNIALLTAPPVAQGLLSGTLDIQSDGATATADGSMKIEKLQVSSKGHPASVAVTADFKTAYVPATEVLNLKTVLVKVGSAQAQISGAINRKNQAENRVTLHADNAALAELGKLLPALGVTLPDNSSFSSGVLTDGGDFRGPFEPLNGQSAINVVNAKLSGFSVTEKISTMAKIAGLPGGRDTEIQRFKANASFVNGAATFTGIELVVPGVTVTGAGTMSADGALNLKMNAVLTGGGRSQLISTLVGSKGVPFLIHGTAQKPEFIPDIGNMAKEEIQNRVGGNLGKALGGLLGKKKK